MTALNRYAVACCVLCGSHAVYADSPPASAYPQITAADAQAQSLFIGGTNFGAALLPVVRLGSTALVVTSYAPTVIVAALPATVPPGSYPLWVQSFSTTSSIQGAWSYLAVTL